MTQKRTAVVFIHGQGEQRPMDSARELARTMWDGRDKGRWSWITPDARFGLADVGRVKAVSQDGKLVDFFEFYYAHKLEGNRTSQAVGFIARLIKRPRDEAPANLAPVRQWVLRFLEFAAITTCAFMFAAAALLGREPIVGGGVDAAWRFGKTLLDWASIAIEGAAAAAPLLGVLALAWNETFGGAAPRLKTKTLEGLKGESFWAYFWARVWIVVGVGILTLLILIVGRQGPMLEARDFALPILMLTAATGALLFARVLDLAVIVGLTGTAIAACAVLGAGPLGAPKLEIAALLGLGSWMHWGAAALFALFAFASLWFLSGLIRQISCATSRVWRLVITLIALAVSVKIGMFAAENLSARTAWADFVYVSGAAIVLVSVLFAVLNHVAGRAFLRPVMADGARYLSRDPENIAARNEIRNAGLALLSELHRPEADYERIVIVAHSLGAIVGYELLSDFWARHCTGAACATPALKEVGGFGDALREKADRGVPIGDEQIAAFQEKQRDFQRSICAGEAGPRWLVTDFITVGAPLSIAPLLLASSNRAFTQQFEDLELAACPPRFGGSVREVRKRSLVSCEAEVKSVDVLADQNAPHHAAMFAAVRWTNLYFKTGSFILAGDAIGGPCAPHFGPGVRDVELKRESTGRVFAHNEYWRSDLITKQLWVQKPAHLEALAEAIGL